jgi:hypothetical protein
LIGLRGFGDHEDRCVGGDGCFLEPDGDFGIVRAGHVDDDCGFGGEADAGKKAGFGGAGKCGEENVGGEAAIGERNFCGGGGGEGGTDARYDFECDVGFAESLEFFGGAAEEERVASFEPDDDLISGGVGEEE